MSHEALIALIDYHYWARDRLLAAVARISPPDFRCDLGNSFGSIRGTLVHLVWAESVWCSRWEGQRPGAHLAPAAFRTVRQIRTRWKREERRVRDFVHRVGPEGIGREIEYAGPGGVRVRSVFWEMLQHVVNHASYHRGQVTTMLRQLGAE